MYTNQRDESQNEFTTTRFSILQAFPALTYVAQGEKVAGTKNVTDTHPLTPQL